MGQTKINTFIEFIQYGCHIEARLRNDHDAGCEKFCGEIGLIRDTLLSRLEALRIIREELSTNNDHLLAQILE